MIVFYEDREAGEPIETLRAEVWPLHNVIGLGDALGLVYQVHVVYDAGLVVDVRSTSAGRVGVLDVGVGFERVGPVAGDAHGGVSEGDAQVHIIGLLDYVALRLRHYGLVYHLYLIH